MKIHERILRYVKIRKTFISILRRYTVDIFPKYTYLHHETSPSITVTIRLLLFRAGRTLAVRGGTALPRRTAGRLPSLRSA